MGSEELVDVSIIFPAYNEARRLPSAVEETISFLRGFAKSYEIIIAEDGSTDGTNNIASQLSKKYNFVKHIHNDKRLGKGRALKEASKKSRGKIIVHMDVDLATNIKHLRELVQSIIDGYDFAIGSRLLPESRVERTPLREFTSRVYNFIMRMLFKTGIRDHQCGFKSFRREALMKIVDEVEANHLFWDTELLVRALKGGCRIREVPVEWKEGGATKVRLFRGSATMFLQALRLWLELRMRRFHAGKH